MENKSKKEMKKDFDDVIQRSEIFINGYKDFKIFQASYGYLLKRKFLTEKGVKHLGIKVYTKDNVRPLNVLVKNIKENIDIILKEIKNTGKYKGIKILDCIKKND